MKMTVVTAKQCTSVNLNGLQNRVQVNTKWFFETGYTTASGFFIKNIDFLHKKVTMSEKPHTLSKSNKRPIIYPVHIPLCPNVHVMLM